MSNIKSIKSIKTEVNDDSKVYKINIYFKSDGGGSFAEQTKCSRNDIKDLIHHLHHESYWVSDIDKEDGLMINCSDVSHFLWGKHYD